MLVTAITTFSPLPSFAELRARLLAFEAQQLHNAAISPTPQPTAFLTQHHAHHQYPRSSRSAPKDSRSQRSFPPPTFSPTFPVRGPTPFSNRRQRPHQHSSGLLGPPPATRSPIQCWTCSQYGHIASQCPQSRAFAGMHVAASSDPTWYLDSGATNHMTNDARRSTNVSSSTVSPHDQVVFGNGDSLPITHSGNVSFSSGNFLFRLFDVLRVPSLHKNLLSVSQFTQDSLVSITFFPWGYIIRDLNTGVVLFQGPCKYGLYPTFPKLLPPSPTALTTVVSSSSLWHRRRGHPSNKVLGTLVSQSLLGSSFRLPNDHCKHCALAKSIRLSFSPIEHSTVAPFDLIHSDVWMSLIASISGFRYYVLFTDDFTRYSWIFPMRLKSEVFGHFSAFVTYVRNHFSISVKTFQSDGGKEFDNSQFRQFCATNGIVHRFSCPHTPQQNGLAERKHRHIADMGRTLLLTAQFPHNLWAEAFCDYVSNKLQPRSLECVFVGYSDRHRGYRCFHPPTGRFYTSRHVVFHEDKFYYFVPVAAPTPAPSCTFDIVPAGLDHEPLLSPLPPPASNPPTVHSAHATAPGDQPQPSSSHPPQPRTTAQPSLPSVSAAQYSLPSLPSAHEHFPPPSTDLAQLDDTSHTSSLTLSPSSDITPPSPEPVPPFPSSDSAPDLTGSRTLLLPASGSASPNVPPCLPTPATRPTLEPPFSSLSSATALDPALAHAPSAASTQPPPSRSSPVHTRSKSGIHKPNPKYRANFSTRYPLPQAFAAFLATDDEPTSYTQASRFPEWKNAMVEEFNALLKQGTWSLVPSSPHFNTVGCKWVFRVKRHSDGTIERHKARLVAKGYHQQPGVDYFDTFSPVVKPTTVRTVLSLAVSSGWSLRQLDVKNAFLHGLLTEEVYMQQPPGFVDPSCPHHVCKLHKAIYGLKQAPHAWFHRFSSFLLRVGFVNSKADSSMFVYQDAHSMMILLLYVDDIVLTGSDSNHLRTFIHRLGIEFEIKDLGRLHYFMGVEVSYLPDSVHLTQNKYTLALLKRSNLLECKPATTPTASKTSLSSSHGSPLLDPTPYRQLVGALQYLTFTRPDISYAVQHVSQFMGSPTDVHFEAVKRILRYLKGTLRSGLPIHLSPVPSLLVAYSDADWAGCPDTRRSTTGYCVFLGKTLISWSAKKQRTVSRSSADAEYRALAHACADTIWIQSLLHELHFSLSKPVLLHCDNLSATYMAANPVFHSRTKHVAIDYHFIRERLTAGSHQVRSISSHDQLADVFTKGLPAARFARLVSNLVTYPASSLRGSIRELPPQS
ncbi:hypothetical protein L3X38_016802 [Prunus dulcis]|uniref:RNA-directed DNA polymerase n=1 Tax=Prunus dulcis TaxID=3755 RepID=A0AAD4W8I3_PRUDU|nr:hypothetical protein L3X38_016802 [Prunus dulcis]